VDQAEVDNLTAGDAEAWRVLLKVQIPRLYGMFMRSWANPSLAEELVSKTVFDAIRGFDTFDAEKGSVEQWLFGIANNNIRLEIRRRASRPTVNGELIEYLESMDDEPLPDEVLERAETAEAVRRAMGRLDEKERFVLEGKYVEGLSAREMAGRIGLTEKAVHSLLYRARQSLRAELKRAPLLQEERKDEA
jgi:RNA polymerase sigma-70 factor (ECF subfamily)